MYDENKISKLMKKNNDCRNNKNNERKDRI